MYFTLVSKLNNLSGDASMRPFCIGSGRPHPKSITLKFITADSVIEYVFFYYQTKQKIRENNRPMLKNVKK